MEADHCLPPSLYSRLKHGYRLSLASQSPRRLQILRQLLGTEIPIDRLPPPAQFGEDLPHTANPRHYVLATALHKLHDTIQQVGEHATPPRLVIAADTIVVRGDGAILEKPASEAHQRAMITAMLQGFPDRRDDYSVLTAVLMAWPATQTSVQPPLPVDDDHEAIPVPAVGWPPVGWRVTWHVERTGIRFATDLRQQYGANTLQTLVDAYVATGDGIDKAGGFGYQSIAMAWVEGIEGCYYNVIGLPAARLFRMLLWWDQECAKLEST